MRSILLVAGALWLASCGAQEKLPADPAPIPAPEPEAIQISGRERLGWDQPASSAAEAAGFRYVAYVDNIATDLQDTACSATAGAAGYACTSRLPAMTPGTHVIEVAVAARAGGWTESPRSQSIRVRLVLPAGGSAAAAADLALVTSDGVHLRATTAATGLEDATDIAVLPDGRVLIAERRGRIRVFQDGELKVAPALTLTDVFTGGGGGLLAITKDLQFEQTGAVYAVYTTDRASRLVRFVVAGDTLVARAILLDGIPTAADWPSTTLRMGPDGKLYLAIDDGGDPSRLGDAGSYNGKVLRLNVDGTTPTDHAGTPVYATGFSRPAGLSWSSETPALWAVGGDAAGRQLLTEMTVGPPRGGEVLSRHQLPAGTSVSGVAVYEGVAIPEFSGHLLLGTEDARGLLRVKLEQTGAVAGTEWLLSGHLGAVRAIEVTSDGAIYVCTSHSLVRITPNLSTSTASR